MGKNRIDRFRIVLLAAAFAAGACSAAKKGPAAADVPQQPPRADFGRRGAVPPTPRMTSGKAGVEWVAIPGGSFRMGEDDTDPPAHRVRVKPFEMARAPVTNRQYGACVQAGACAPARVYGPKFQGGDQPVVGVTWEQARAFSVWVGGRLPSEAEWEYAARSAGKNYYYPWGNERMNCERAVAYDKALGGFGCGRGATWPVCLKPRGNTEQGLCDMGGNVNEWVQDLAHRQYYKGAPDDGSAWESPEDTWSSGDRIIRGRPWDEADSVSLSSRSREWERPEYEFDYLGFRPAR